MPNLGNFFGVCTLFFAYIASSALECPTAHACSKVASENNLPGAKSSEWDVNGAGDPTIQGFATDSSVLPGDTLHVKVLTDSNSYRMDVYRMGYYNGTGARRVASIERVGPP